MSKSRPIAAPPANEETVIGLPPRAAPAPPGRLRKLPRSEATTARRFEVDPSRLDDTMWQDDPSVAAPSAVADAVTGNLTGSVLGGRYRLLRVLGEGGMGLVYEAEHMALEKRVAVKVLSREYSSQPDAVDRFVREARATSKLDHDHIIQITDFGTAPNGSAFFAMELLDGEDLGATIQRDGALPWARARHMMLQICDALGAAHAAGVVHRDMKPDNCFRTTRRGDVDYIKLLDFGIAKLLGTAASGKKITKTGQIFGTPEYMAPELIRGTPADARLDVYAAGVILYELLTGATPFSGDTFLQVLMRHAQEQPVPPSSARPDLAIPRSVDEIVLRALAKDPDHRYQTASELADAIRTAGGTAPTVLRPAATTVRSVDMQSPVAAQPPPKALLVVGPDPLARTERSPRSVPNAAPRSRASPARWRGAGAVVVAGVAAVVLAIAVASSLLGLDDDPPSEAVDAGFGATPLDRDAPPVRVTDPVANARALPGQDAAEPVTSLQNDAVAVDDATGAEPSDHIEATQAGPKTTEIAAPENKGAEDSTQRERDADKGEPSAAVAHRAAPRDLPPLTDAEVKEVMGPLAQVVRDKCQRSGAGWKNGERVIVKLRVKKGTGTATILSVAHSGADASIERCVERALDDARPAFPANRRASTPSYPITR